MTHFNIILYDGFELLDAFGPAEMIGSAAELYRLGFYSLAGGLIVSAQNAEIQTRPFSQMDAAGVLLIPGGTSSRTLAGDPDFVGAIKALAEQAEFVLNVCTGAALLANTGLLNGRAATTNKQAFAWVSSQSREVHWQKRARWVRDGKYYTSSGVSAGMDMTLAFIRDRHGEELVRKICADTEYVWNSDPDNDPFGLA